MSFYIAGRTANFPAIQELAKQLEDLGLVNAYDWTTQPSYKPYQ